MMAGTEKKSKTTARKSRKKPKSNRGGVRYVPGTETIATAGVPRPNRRKDPTETRDHRGFFRFGDSLLERLKKQGYDPDRRGVGTDGRSNSDVLLDLVMKGLTACEAEAK